PFLVIARSRATKQSSCLRSRTGLLRFARNDGVPLWTARAFSPKETAMRFLKTLFWVVLAVMMTQFAMQNWHVVEVRISDTLRADVKLAFLVLIACLLGLVHCLLLLAARLWSVKRRLGL